MLKITVQDVKANPALIRAIEDDLSRPGAKAVFTIRIARVLEAVLNERGFQVAIGYTYEGGNAKAYLRKAH